MKRRAWHKWATSLKDNLYALSIAARDPRIPLSAKIIIGFVVAYALSPIDLIPDFIPVIGYMDDLILLPLGILLAIRIIPPQVWSECRALAADSECLRKGIYGLCPKASRFKTNGFHKNREEERLWT